MERIRILRESRNMSQQRLAADLNVTQAMVSKYELGLSEPDICMIKRIAGIFNVSSDYLLGISEDKINLPSSLSEEEKGILFGFKRLDSIQKAKLQAYLQGLLQE